MQVGISTSLVTFTSFVDETPTFAPLQSFERTLPFPLSSLVMNVHAIVLSKALPGQEQQTGGAFNVAVLGPAAIVGAMLIALVAIFVKRLLRRRAAAPEEEPENDAFATSVWDFRSGGREVIAQTKQKMEIDPTFTDGSFDDRKRTLPCRQSE
jgi:hypothetical protein